MIPGKEVYVTDKDRLVWADRFTRERLGDYSAGDWLNLRDKIAAFFGRAGKGKKKGALWTRSNTIVVTKLDKLRDSDIRALQKETKRIFDGILTGTGKSVKLTDPRFSMIVSRHFEPQMSVYIENPREAFLYVVLELLKQMRALKLEMKRCPAAGCGNNFIRVRRQLFCSQACRWRQDKKDKRGS